MSISNGNFSASIGRDCTVVVMGPTGVLSIPNVTRFEAKEVTANITVDRLDGNQILADLSKGWSGTIEAVRGDAGIDSFFANQEQLWYSAGTYQTSSMFQYITEKDGSTTTFQFTNVALSLEDAGTWQGDADVKQRINWRANRRVQV